MTSSDRPNTEQHMSSDVVHVADYIARYTDELSAKNQNKRNIIEAWTSKLHTFSEIIVYHDVDENKLSQKRYLVCDASIL